MSYCQLSDLKRLLPPNVQIGDANIGTPSPSAQQAKRDSIKVSDANQYILYAQEYIDARLRPFYVVPLRKIKTYEDDVFSDVPMGLNVPVKVKDSVYFTAEDVVRIQDRNKNETCTVKSIQDSTTIILSSVQSSYLSSDGLMISIVKFPEQISVIAARLAVSFAFDVLYVQSQSPDVSSYGKTQRNLSREGIENILTGEVALFGQELTGRRFLRGQLFDAYRSPADVAKGSEPKENG